jgi:hypothetical protein
MLLCVLCFKAQAQDSVHDTGVELPYNPVLVGVIRIVYILST